MAGYTLPYQLTGPQTVDSLQTGSAANFRQLQVYLTTIAGSSNTPTGPAGGSLTGTYPNPGLGSGVIGSAQLASGAVTNTSVSASAAIAYSKLSLAGSIQALDISPTLSITYFVVGATAVALPANTYSAPSLTATSNGVLAVDGLSLSVNDRILVKNEVASTNDGIYAVVQPGTVSTPYILTRSVDMPVGASLQRTLEVKVQNGTANAHTKWYLNSSGVVVDSSAQSWVQSAFTAATANPLVDGTANAGTLGLWSRGDHVHPTDTSRLSAVAVAGGDLTGNYPSPTIATGAVTSAKILDGTITTADLAFSALPPNGTAGGSLSGTYPNPTLSAGSVGTSQIIDGSILDVDINTGAQIQVSKLASGPASYVLTASGGGVWDTTKWDAGFWDGTPSYQPAVGVPSWTTIFERNITIGGTTTANSFVMGGGNGIAAAASFMSDTPFPGFSVDPADYVAPSGRTLQFRVHAMCFVNATATTSTMSVGLNVLTVAGGASALTLSVGSLFSGSSCAFASGPTSVATVVNSSSFSLPSGAQTVGLVDVQSGTVAAASTYVIVAALQYRHV